MGLIMRLFLRLQRKRRVRLHLFGDAPSVEGILLGRWASDYVLFTPGVVREEGQTVELSGHLQVPRANVMFVQVLP